MTAALNPDGVAIGTPVLGHVVSEVDHPSELHPDEQELLRQLQTQLPEVTELVGRYDRFVLMRRILG